MTEQPRTAAVQFALIEVAKAERWDQVASGTLRTLTAAIEAQARPAVASEGLRAALEAFLAAADRMEDAELRSWGWSRTSRLFEQARAALASDAGRSVGALDVERPADYGYCIHGVNPDRDCPRCGEGIAADAERQGES